MKTCQKCETEYTPGKGCPTCKKELRKAQMQRYLAQPGKKEAHRKGIKNWGMRNADRVVDIQKNAALQRMYGMSLEEFNQRLQSQSGVCAICKREPATAVDHDHATGKVRSLLCGTCNTGLGHFKDDITLLEAAITYLKEHSE